MDDPILTVESYVIDHAGLIDAWVERWWRAEYMGREALAWDALVSGAFQNELCATQTTMDPSSWRLV